MKTRSFPSFRFVMNLLGYPLNEALEMLRLFPNRAHSLYAYAVP